MNIHTLYAQAHEELRQLSVQLARMAEQMSSSKHLHPLDKPLPFLSDYAERLATAQRLITKHNTLLELNIELSSGIYGNATITHLPAASNQGPTGDIGPEGPSMFRFCQTPGCSGPLHLKGQTHCADCLLAAQQSEPEIPSLEVTPPSEVKPDMPGWLDR